MISRPDANAYTRRQSALVESITRKLSRKSELEIVLEGRDEFVRSYSTHDSVTGHVEYKSEKDTLINDVSIILEGQSNTFVEKLATTSPTTGRTTGRHTFLRMQQPIYQDQLPEDSLAKANTTYHIPFTFVVPDKLLPHSCTHKVEHEDVTHHHLQLPPSMGDPLLAGDGNTLMDDLAPEMSKITYSIKARLSKSCPQTGRVIDDEEKVIRIRVAPSRDEEPPLIVDADNSSFTLRKEKNVRKGVFKIGKKIGRLTATVAQPKSLRLPHHGKRSPNPVTTVLAVGLRFDPASEDEQPPQLASLSSRLKAYTFFGATSYKIIPETSRCDNWSTLHGLFPETIDLPSRNIGNVSWRKHDSEDQKKPAANTFSNQDLGLSRRPSTFSTGSDSSCDDFPAASSDYDPSRPFYTSRLLLPVTLPGNTTSSLNSRSESNASSTNKINTKKLIFIPTFHSCIVSRTYAIDLSLSFIPVNSQGGSGNALASSSLSLRTPVQISQEGSGLPLPRSAMLVNPAMYDLNTTEGLHEEDEEVARQLDRELNFANPFHPSRRFSPTEAIPEYEEIETNFPSRPLGAARHQSIAVMPGVDVHHEQPPEYSSPFSARGAAGAGRRVSVRC